MTRDDEEMITAYMAAILLAPIARFGVSIEQRTTAVREARYILQEIQQQFALEPVAKKP